MRNRDLEAEIYVDWPLTLEELAAIVVAAIGGKIIGFEVVSKAVSLSVMRYPDRAGHLGKFHYYVEVAPVGNADQPAVIAEINLIAAALKRHKIDYEVACDFEDKII